MANVIAIQEEYIGTLNKLDTRSRNFYTNANRAARKAKKALMTECGFDINMADKAAYDAYDVWRNENASIFDPLNH